MYDKTLVILYILVKVVCYEIPTPKLEALYPRGIRASLPDDNYTLFVFHAKLNEDFNGHGPLYLYGTISRPENGKWIYTNNEANLKIGDKLYLLLAVIKNSQVHWKRNAEWTVTEFVDQAGNPVHLEPESNSVSNVTKSSTQTIKDPAKDSLDPCEVSETIASVSSSICKGQLIFEENFDFKIEQSRVWAPEVKFPGEPDYPFNVYLMGNHVQTSNGTLKIKPVTLNSIYGEDSIFTRLDLTKTCTGVLGTSECYREAFGPQILPPVVTAKITTKESFSFKYGRIEVSAKMPKGSWIFPEIQLEPRDHKYGVMNYASGILRFGCVRENEDSSRSLYGGPVLSGTGPLRTAYLSQARTYGTNHWSQYFHTYALEWKPDGIKLFVDNDQYGAVRPRNTFADGVNADNVPAASFWRKGSVLAPFDEMFYISLGLTVGGVNEFSDSSKKPWTNGASKAMLNFWNARTQWYPSWVDDVLEIDYVKVYAL